MNNELKEQNIASKVVIGERDKLLEEKNIEIKRKDEKLERWSEEVRRLENQLESKKMQQDELTRDFDRIRS